ncbi:MAG: type II CRISPR RNA-guided endonuclease Cas9, partial [Bacteroidales bacterium]|nr:type II CRISPR RNA-guided endonuclease Cas9 [Bacteroidales bacterium]
MKKILGLDLGVGSIGWAVVNEAENENENNSIVRLGVRVNPLTVDEQKNFEEGKSITTNADRTLKRSARRNLQRFRARRDNLIKILKEYNFITDDTVLCETGKNSTHETLRLRALSVNEKITLEEFARVLLSINAQRGYKSSRKVKQSEQEDGHLIDSMDVARILQQRNITPGQYCLEMLQQGNNNFPEFYRSDLQNEFDRIWNYQKQYHKDILTEEFYTQLKGKSRTNSTKIFLGKYEIFSADIKGNKQEVKQQELQLRCDALARQLQKDELATVLSDINGQISGSSGYLGAISDRSKELYFQNITVGQYIYNIISDNPNASLKNMVFYRNDYIEEFERIWNKQAEYYTELTDDLKKTIRDNIIFYQRRLKSQKGLLDYCTFESREIEVLVDGKKKIKRCGLRVCSKSSLYFQEFKIWQVLNNLMITDAEGNKRYLDIEEKDLLFKELTYKSKLKKSEILRLLFKNTKDMSLNYEEIEGNRTLAALINAAPSIKDDIQYKFNSNEDGENQLIVKLWHLLYSYEGDNSKTGNDSLIKILENLYGFSNEEAKRLANISFQDDYSNLSTKAIKKILPYLKEDYQYDEACSLAGYRHSAQSLTRDEIDNKTLKDKLDLLPKNSLRNPVVEKILNQMVNVVNELVEEYGQFDEIRIELARELKQKKEKREESYENVKNGKLENEKCVKEIKEIFKQYYNKSLQHVSHND